MNSISDIDSERYFSRATPRRAAHALCSALLVGTLSLLAAPSAAAQAGADHSLIWTGGDIIYIDPAGTPPPASRAGPGGNPLLGTVGMPYADVTQAVNDILWNSAYTPVFPVVFNVKDGGTPVTSYPASSLRIPANGVKLQTLSNQTIELVGIMIAGAPEVLLVNAEGHRFFSSGLPMPASIIQGFTIRGGGTGIRMDVATANSAKPLRTEVRDCIITANRFKQIFQNPTPPGGTAGGGTGISITTHPSVPTQYVIEHNEIFGQGEFFYGDNGPASRGIQITVGNGGVDSTLIRGNQLHDQETGIQIQSVPTAWCRPRILSNFLWDHEQHIISQEAGPALFNNTIFRARDFCMGPDRHVVHHQATSIPNGSDAMAERAAMIVRNCIIEYSVPPIQTGGTPRFPPTWLVDTFCGGGSVVLSNSDIEPIIGVFPNNFPATPGAIPCALTPLSPPAAAGLTLLSGNFFGRPTNFVNSVSPNLHLQPSALQAESGDANDVEPGVALILVDTDWLPCDVRTDVDGDVRLIDMDRNGTLVPDRGGDEVSQPPNFGITLRALNADRTGNLPTGSTLNLEIKGMPGDLAVVQGWLDCSSNSSDDVIYNNLDVAPVGNLLLPQCGVVNSPLIVLDSTGTGTLSLPLSGPPEMQVYFQAIAFTGSNPSLGTASNRVRIELN